MPDDQNKVLAALAQMMTKADKRFDQITAHIDSTHNDAMTKMDGVYKLPRIESQWFSQEVFKLKRKP